MSLDYVTVNFDDDVVRLPYHIVTKERNRHLTVEEMRKLVNRHIAECGSSDISDKAIGESQMKAIMSGRSSMPMWAIPAFVVLACRYTSHFESEIMEHELLENKLPIWMHSRLLDPLAVRKNEIKARFAALKLKSVEKAKLTPIDVDPIDLRLTTDSGIDLKVSSTLTSEGWVFKIRVVGDKKDSTVVGLTNLIEHLKSAGRVRASNKEHDVHSSQYGIGSNCAKIGKITGVVLVKEGKRKNLI